MATKIFYNDNRIIIDGHADNAEECQTITAMCDEMANSENFKTIVYEQGHAVFERVGGGDAMRFNSALEAQVAALKQQVANIRSCECDMSLYLSKNEASFLYETKTAHENSMASHQSHIDQIYAKLGYIETSKGTVAEQLSALIERVSALENKTTKTLPFTADQLIAKLESI